MAYQIEVCIDNLESLPIAIAGGATRIELCSSLELGGLTPSFGLMRMAAKLSTIPVYAMIRPRQGDFLFSQADLEQMLFDIDAAKQAGLDGIVIGAMTPDGDIDTDLCQQLIERADGLGITFHRAIDQCRHPQQALEEIIQLGCERVLTSGLAASAELGMDQIAQFVTQANGRISIMAGAGVSAQNALNIAQTTQVDEIHLSAKSTRPSQMAYIAEDAHMGNQSCDDFAIPVTSLERLRQVTESLNK
ncbi:copper homeostasis protein CutC [Vibrio sp. SCSIO 43136]|uniref:copper homeostasis protein CutC n=1 Tax=Vibrio sp. SCSIO 43136 TaxID=2819101 RepID=UPI002075082E|nr:copper homeostasis protein CutC [Vibrio sp. SCSIO 43136]USD65773.1 copper homeostasis protein CutC [Vibrio sp. SCSIO 43136]